MLVQHKPRLARSATRDTSDGIRHIHTNVLKYTIKTHQGTQTVEELDELAVPWLQGESIIEKRNMNFDLIFDGSAGIICELVA